MAKENYIMKFPIYGAGTMQRIQALVGNVRSFLATAQNAL